MDRALCLKGQNRHTKSKKNTQRTFQGNQHVYKTGYTKESVKRLRAKRGYPVQKILRLTRYDFRRITATRPGWLTYHITTPTGNRTPDEHVNVMLLRAKPDKGSLTEQYLQQNKVEGEEMRLLGRNSTTKMWNKCVCDHNLQSKMCSKIELDVIKEIKIGLCWQQQLGCQNCRYQSGVFKLYQEIENTGERYVEMQ